MTPAVGLSDNPASNWNIIISNYCVIRASTVWMVSTSILFLYDRSFLSYTSGRERDAVTQNGQSTVRKATSTFTIHHIGLLPLLYVETFIHNTRLFLCQVHPKGEGNYVIIAALQVSLPIN